MKPPERLFITGPAAIPEDNSTATDASPEILKLCLIRVMITALIKDTAYAVQSGYIPTSKPAAIPPNEECATASPNNEYLLRTRNKPITEHKIAIAIPEIKALCINPYDKISRDMTIRDDACVPALMLLSTFLLVLDW